MTERQKKPTRAASKTKAKPAPTKQPKGSKTQAGDQKVGRSNGFLEVLAELAQDELEPLLDGLPPKRRAFVFFYCTNGFNGTQAAISAGYSKRSARSIASELLTKPDIRAALDGLMERMEMSPAEVIARMSGIARADISPYIMVKDGRLGLDIAKLRDDGLGYIIKEIWQTPEGLRVKVHDSMVALENLGRKHKLFVNAAETQVGDITVVLTWPKEKMEEAPGGNA